LTVGASGTPANPITIRVGQDAGHNGRVILDFSQLGDKADSWGINCSKSDVVFDGSVNGVSRFEVRNLYNIVSRTLAVGLGGGTGERIKVRYMTFTNVNNGVRLGNNPGQGYEVSNCTFTGIRGDEAIEFSYSSGGLGANKIFNNYIETLFYQGPPPPGKEGAIYSGPDGVQAGGSVDVYNNTFRVSRSTDYTSTQHPDTLQLPGSNLRIYNNEFINVGDSVMGLGSWWEGASHENILIYNNILRIEEDLDPTPQFIRFYNNSHAIARLANVKILNNVFSGASSFHVSFTLGPGAASATGEGNELKNNIFLGSNDSQQIIRLKSSPNFSPNAWTVSNNVFENGTSTLQVLNEFSTTAQWSASTSDRVGVPQFVHYVNKDANNNYRLQAGDSVARDAALDMSSHFTTDRVNVLRPQGGAWDIGPYEFDASGGATTPPDPPGALLASAIATDRITLSWSDNSDDESGFQLERSLSAGGGFVPVAGIAANQTNFTDSGLQPETLYHYRLRAYNGAGNSAYTSVAGATTAAIAAFATGAFVDATSGEVTAPFSAGTDGVSQTIETTDLSGGRASYYFDVTVAGEYAVVAEVDAPDASANSFFVNVGAEPFIPDAMWHIPVTTGYEVRPASWQGSGTFDNPEFVPRYFNLGVGQHEVVIRGREAGAVLKTIALIKRPQAPTPNNP
ncbi:MAG: hypothetical protein HKO57_10725, partial [Akkermansiaceae bacterium]|nr:hypothetical protein [Akkermansiaceae bacterium]